MTNKQSKVKIRNTFTETKIINISLLLSIIKGLLSD